MRQVLTNYILPRFSYTNMKKLIITFSLLFSVIHLTTAQNPLPELLKNFQYQKALEYIETQESTHEMLMQKALCFKALGDYRKSIEILQPLAQECKDDIQILSELAICYQSVALRQASIDCYDELIRIDSANIYFKIQKAELLFQQGKYERALELFYPIYDQGKSTNTLKQIAQCYEMMNKVDSAILYYRKTLDQNPLDGFSAASLTNICLKEGLLEEGKACSEVFMELDTTNLQVNLLNALCYYASEEEYPEAIERFLKCESIGDSTLILNRSLGTSYYMIKNYYDAEIYLDKAFQQDTTNNTVMYALAVSSTELGDYVKSIPLFERLSQRIQPDSLLLSMCFKNLASACQKGRDVQGAIDAYKKALLYVKADQKMEMYYKISDMYYYSLEDHKNALVYYNYYRDSLAAYLEKLKSESATKERIADTEERLQALKEHIAIVKTGKKPERKPVKMMITDDKGNTKEINLDEYVAKMKEKQKQNDSINSIK